MKSLTLSTIALAGAVAPVFADDLKVVNFKNLGLKPRSRISSVKFLQDRANTAQATLSNQQNLYAINLAVGTPAQNISVQIDTGSSDLWFPVTNSNLCNLRSSECDTFGSYSPSSSTRKNLGDTFSIQYGDGTKIQGVFVTDNVEIGDTPLKAVQFAACSSGSSQTGVQGILGIGYESNEAGAASSEAGSTYPNLLSSMKSQGFISTMAYSMWLNDPDSADGNVLFGGVDSAKYTGSLISMPVVPNQGGTYDTLSMPLTGITVSADGQSFTFTPTNFAYPALIDSGTTLMYLPDDVVEAIWTSLGVTIKSQTPLLPCNYGNDPSAKLTFTFNGDNGAKIDVLLNDLLAEVQYSIGGSQACELLISGGAPEGLIILGDAFMRSAYIVYDLENNNIAIAQSKFNVSDSNIKEITGSSIPGASVMSTLVAGLAVATSATDDIPSQETAFQTGGATGALETTATAPTFRITATGKSSASGQAQMASIFSIFGLVAGTVTIMSVFGGAMIIWS